MSWEKYSSAYDRKILLTGGFMGCTLIGNDNVIVTNMTLKDIALLTGTSVNTVSRALNKKDGVSPKTREKILAVAEAHHYHPNLLARSMRLKDTRLVGILVGDITNPFFVSLLDGAYEEASAESVTIIVGNSRENFGLQRESIDAFLSYNCRGLRSASLSRIPPRPKAPEPRLNFVIIDTHIDGSSPCDRVHINDEADCMRAIEYLHSCGQQDRCDQLGYRTVNERDRIVGVKKAFASCGLPWRKGESISAGAARMPARVRLKACGGRTGLRPFSSARRPTASGLSPPS
jgi:DNA-binding LacI/PurR family transcriptional regulator